MLGFHIDMNMVQYNGDYLKKWLKNLSDFGYDTIIWEVENNIQWETCPECVSPDAFTKAEFKDILDYSKELGLEPIPLLQVISHGEYVLKHDKYKHMAELDGKIVQYCPLKTELIEFLHNWTAEYLDLFGELKYFHIGADEAWSLGQCPKCADFVSKNSLSELYINHINTIAEPIIAQDITPVIWGDMILHHPEALEKLTRKIMVFDWMYDIYRGEDSFFVWGEGKRTGSTISKKALKRFKTYIFPDGDEPGAIPETFYTADFLAAQGFKTVTCPGSSISGDNVFSPRNMYHMRNSFDSIHKGLSQHLSGSVLTSWSVHLFPWELQLACISMPRFIKERPDSSLNDYKKWFLKEFFNLENDKRFWLASGLLSKRCLFTSTYSLGFNKNTLPVPEDHVQNQIKDLAKTGKLDIELENCYDRLEEYQEGLKLFNQLSETVSKNNDLITQWQLASKNLINRAKASIYLLEKEKGESSFDASAILNEMRELRKETESRYEPICKPSRRNEILDYIYASIEHALLA